MKKSIKNIVFSGFVFILDEYGENESSGLAIVTYAGNSVVRKFQRK